MKCFTILFFAILLSAIIPTKSIAQNEKFIGSWRVDIDRTLAMMDSNVKARYDTLSEETHSRAVNAMSDHPICISERSEHRRELDDRIRASRFKGKLAILDQFGHQSTIYFG